MISLIRVLALLALSWALSPPVFGQGSGSRPNIIFVLCDDLGYGDVGYFFQNLRAANNKRSEPWHFTPNLDTLASEGLQLPHHYCPAPVCAPSRGSLLTGVHQGHANVRDNQFDKALENNHTLATVLKGAGYATACIGKWGLQGSGGNPTAWPAYPTKRGFDYYYGYVRHGDGHEHYPKEGGAGGGPKEVWENNTEVSAGLDKCYTTDLFTARSKQWIADHRAANPTQPFFLFLAYDTPHAVLEYPTQAYPAGSGLTGGLQWNGTPGNMINTASGTLDSYAHPDYGNATYDDDGNAGTVEVAWPAVYKRFATSVRRIDDCIGDLVQTLKDLGVDDNTLVVFTTDNGPSKEDYLNFAVSYAPTFFNSFGPFDGIKRDCWEGGIRVGAMVRWPGGVPGNRTSNLPCQFHDWLPTFADLAGLPAPARADGVSLLPTLANVGLQETPQVYVEYFEGGTTPSYTEFQSPRRGRDRDQMQAIRIGDFMGVRYNVLGHANPFEIYNVVADPKQTTNLAGGNASLQQQMKDTVLRLRRPDGSASRPYDSELVPPLTPSPTTNGVAWRAYPQAFSWVPKLEKLTPSSSGTSPRPDLAVRPRDQDIGLLFSGYLNAPADGEYTLSLKVDTTALLRIHEATVIDSDFAHVGGTEDSGTIRLKAGKHPFRLYYRRGTAGTPALSLQWSGPGFAKQTIPDSAFFRDGAGAPTPPNAHPDQSSTTQGTAVDIAVLVNDIDDGTPQPLSIVSVTPPLAGSASITGGQIRYTPRAGFLGTDTFNYTVTDGSETAAGSVTVDVFFESGDHWYPLNQTSGRTTTEAEGLRTAILNGFTNDPNQWVAGRTGRALSFDGVDDYVGITGFSGITGTAARTCSAWVKTTTNSGSHPIIAWGPNTSGAKWTFLMTPSGQIRTEITNGIVVGTRAVNDGDWHHVACTFISDGSPNAVDIKLYVDGAPEALSSSTANALNTTASGEAKIGSDIQGRFWQGAIQHARIYPRALGAAEIAAEAAQTHPAALAWQRRFYGDNPVSWLADTDGDQWNALLEYALGGQPHLSSGDPFPNLVDRALAPNFTFQRPATGTSELVYQVQASTNVQNWSLPVQLFSTAPTVEKGMPMENVTYRPSGSENLGRTFYRVAVELP
jgi:arylsulfatase A-like enzyme